MTENPFEIIEKTLDRITDYKKLEFMLREKWGTKYKNLSDLPSRYCRILIKGIRMKKPSTRIE